MTDQIESEATPPSRENEPELTTASLARAASATPVEQPLADQTESRSFAPAGAGLAADVTPLFAAEEAQGLRSRWDAIQASFVDEPRKAVEEADSLVANTMKRLAEMFAEERAGLEGQWDRGDDVSTEDLRLALQRYRSFFGRLLAI